MTNNYTDWLTKEEAAERLGVSPRTVMRLADGNKIQQRMRPRAGGSPLAVFHPADVDRVAAERSDPKLFWVPDEQQELRIYQGPTAPAEPAAPALPRMAPETLVEMIVDAADRLITARKTKETKELAVLIPEKPRLTLREAVALGFQAEDLRQRVKAGTLENVGSPHRYRFRRRDLDAL